MQKWWAVFGLVLTLQGAFWWQSVEHRPRLLIVPSVPSEIAVKALSFGDNHAFFRVLGLYLQNFGDSFGRFTPLKDYDYAKLKRWFDLLDTLDARSDFVPMIASYYYSQTQNTPDVRYVVEYLRDHTEGRLDKKWWWRTQAVYLAQHKLHDTQLALGLASPLLHTRDVPVWVNQLPAFIHEKRGEFADALTIMEHVKQHGENLSAGELNFIRHFIEERLQALEQQLPADAADQQGATQ